MSGDTTERKNNSFDDYYKTDNLDDSELQAQLYAEIYYKSNIEGESGATDVPRTIKFNSMAIEMNVESESTQRKPEEQSSVSKTTEADSQRMQSTDQTEFAQVEVLASKEINPVHECNNEHLEDPSVTQGKESKEDFSKKCKSSKHAKNTSQESSERDHNDTAYSKYNVVSKSVKQKKLLAQQANKAKDSSDSEESIFEVPVPPKPKPLIIDVQDSDEENDSNSGINKDDLILKKWNNVSAKIDSKMIPNDRFINCETTKASGSHQNTSSKSWSRSHLENWMKSWQKHSKNHNKPTVNPSKSIQTSTRAQEDMEDIVLNCTTIQRGAKSINEIKQLSKSTGIYQKSQLTEDTNQSHKKTSSQNKLKRNNESTNLQQETSVTSGRNLQMMRQNVDKNNVHNVYNLRHKDQDGTSGAESRNPVTDRKRQWNDQVNSQSKQKRQCIIQQNNRNVMPQANSGGQTRNVSSDFFEPMTEEMKNYYNSNHGQENFDVGELQQGMSKDPQMWAILDEDIMPCPSSRRIRFWNARCTNCHQDGHRRYECPASRKPLCCYMCGMKGHAEFRCPQKMCLTCGKRQNTFRNICEYCRVLYCTMCNSAGHEQEQCPDLWRRYHQTTDMNSTPQDPGNVMKPSRLLYCCNCAKRGHESSMCREYRWSEHFPTPASVTSYTDGPTYVPSSPRPSSSSRLDTEIDFLSQARENETSIPQNAINKQQTMTENVEFSVNVNTSDINLRNTPILQEAEGISQVEENLESSTVNNIWPTVKTNLKQTKVKTVTFSGVIYSYGWFNRTHHKDARMILINLTTYFTHRESTLNSLINRKIAPGFLKTLLAVKEINFEVKIGYNVDDRQAPSLRLLAMKEYIEYLYDLLRYWLDLPDDEKDYGIDVALPINTIKMINVLNSRLPQIQKTYFTCYSAHIGGMNDPRWIYNMINSEKNNLKQFKGSTKKYNQARKRLFRWQTKLLMIVNTEPKPNVFVRTFEDMLRNFKSKLDHIGEKLDIATYLRIILLYNHLFVPHTSENVNETLRRIEIEEKKMNDSQIQQKVHHVPEVREQRNHVYDVHSSSAVSCTSQNINSENSLAINDQQNNEVLDDGQNLNGTSLETSKILDRNCDEIILINDSLTQEPQIIPLNTEPVSVQSKNLARNEGQLSTSKVNIESNVSANKQNVNVNDIVCTSLAKKQRRKKLQEERKKMNNAGMITPKNIYKFASSLIHKARGFQLPHMMNAAKEMQKLISNQTITPKQVKTLSKLIKLEENYRRNVNTYCKVLKK